ncbi:DUF2785 domain-containing protein [Pontibacillus sp. ALD_SL1]|uniref:DUF2785 domain-containing protein n=1 Tax=Pontibacillus sp. ALD_SL1 TaxID=2777185 RepID=UPI001A96905E|nr:DUF2785 domain-containing protein [Pontibacillus sp. ALD_SL1]QSS98745.1 DUF2785 domain-containing protein [Pontibacillus sp. ALD_SL1]
MKTKESFKQMSINEWPTEEGDEWITWMLDHIGDVDPELRDGCIYPAFGELIHSNRLHSHQIDRILETCLSRSHLFYHIGEKEGDGVFTRSFSALVIAEIVKHEQGWEREQYERVLKYYIEYLKEEKDVRGYVENKGWAHSIAHGADVLVALVEHSQFRKEDAPLFLQAVRHAFWKEDVFADDEEERLSFVIGALFRRDVAPSVITYWINKTFLHLESIWNAAPFTISVFRIRTNVLHFMKALYFRLETPDLQHTIKQYLEEWHQRVYHNS